MSLRTSSFALVALMSAALSSSACTADRPTGVVAGVTTQMKIPRDVQFIRLMAKSGSHFVLNEIYRVVDGSVTLPGTLTFAPADGVGRGQSITITVLGYASDPSSAIVDETVEGNVSFSDKAPRVLRRTVLGYDAGRVAYLPVNLSYSCMGVPCDGGQTCVAGRCASDSVDVTTLPTFIEGLFEATSDACFDATTCMTLEMPARLAGLPDLTGASTSASVVDRCTFTMQGTDPSGKALTLPAGTALNVRVVFGHANSTSPSSTPREEILNEGPDGFTIPDRSKPGTFRLADGLCNALGAPLNGDNLATEVYVAPTALCVDGECSAFHSPCASKRAAQSLCARNAAGNGGEGSLCTEQGLTPSPSAMGILIDRRDTMRGPLTSSALGTLLGLPMRGTLLRNTKIAVAFTPSRQADAACASAATSALGQGSNFGAVADATKPVIGFSWLDAKLAPDQFATFQVPGESPLSPLLSPLNMTWGSAEYAATYETFLAAHPAGFDTALAPGGFYDFIRVGLTAQNAAKGALFVLGTRDFEGTCGDLDATTVFAQTAHLAGIDTYVLALPDSNPQIATGPFIDAAQNLATAGGTTFFDATTRNAANDTAKGLEAFTRAAVDLATCTYESAPAIGTKLSYVNATGVRVALDSNAACTGGRGWTTMANRRAKLCDTTCSDYRELVKTRGLIAAMGGSSLDEVPIVIRTNCND
jgi:hypothetical protein